MVLVVTRPAVVTAAVVELVTTMADIGVRRLHSSGLRMTIPSGFAKKICLLFFGFFDFHPVQPHQYDPAARSDGIVHLS